MGFWGFGDNFNVDGDLRSLVSVGPIGTTDDNSLLNGNPRYNTGFDLQVGGRLGQITSRSQFLGKTEVVNGLDPANDPDNLGIRQTYRELEFVPANNLTGPFNDLISDLDARNDDPNRPEILGSYLEQVPGQGLQYVASVTGQLQTATTPSNDHLDTFGLALMGGQKIVVDINAGIDLDGDGRISTAEESLAGFVDVGLFDPDGRLVATDYPLLGNFGAPFGYTADRPGLYRLIVAANGNTDFAGAGLNVGAVDYTIDVRGPGDLAYGGMSIGGDIRTITSADADADPANPNNTSEASIRLRQGDMGAILASGSMIDFAGSSFAVDNGDLRGLQANSVGILVPGGVNAVVVEVPNGNVGFVSANRGGGGIVAITTALDDLFAPIAVGGNMQVISADSSFFGDLRVDGGIGVIRAADFAIPNVSINLFVDFDRNGGGFIDTIDCVGDFGTITGGGPAIDTGLGGNVRYIQAGGDLFFDPFFSGGVITANVYTTGTEVPVVDDSGARLVLKPINNASVTGAANIAALTVLTYPIRSGGGVLVDVQSTGSIEIEGKGAGVAEVSRLEIAGLGQTVTSLSDNATPTPPATSADRGDTPADTLVLNNNPAGSSLSALITGGVTVDVFNVIVVSQFLTIATGNATSIRNETRDGEIVNVLAQSIGDLYARGPLGLAKSQSGAAIVRYSLLTLGDTLPTTLRPTTFAGAPIGDVFPFLGQTTGIVVSGGNIRSISSDMGIGNVAIHGSIGSVTPNQDQSDDDDAFEGINAPIVAFNFNGAGDLNGRPDTRATVRLAGRLNFVNIGDGILPAGTGNLGRAGLYADRPIDLVQNQGLTSDIRGTVISRTAINHISLNDGAIINSTIAVLSQFDDTSVLDDGLNIPPSTDPLGATEFEIGGIDLTGRGGILSSFIAGPDIGQIKIDGGFGLIRSSVSTISSTRVEGIQTDGYGIRNSFIELGASGGFISAKGDGSSASVLKYTPSVRFSENVAADPGFLDPFFDVIPTTATDLYLAIGTTAAAPEVAGTTDTGIIEDTDIAGFGNVSSISAFSIRASGNGVPVLRDPDLTGIDPPTERALEPMKISVGNGIGSLVTRGPINGLFLSTGRIGTFAPGGDVFNTDLTISGPIGLMKINGDFAQTSRLFASGPNGRIKKLQIVGDLIGDITSDGQIGDVTVTGLVDGTITSRVAGGRATSIKSINIGGVTPDGHLTIVGNLGKLTVNGDLGTIGSVNNQVNVTGSAKTIRINGDLQTNVTVSQDLNLLDVRGNITSSNVTVTDTLKSIKVAGDLAADSVVTATVVKKQAIKGNVFGQIVVTG